MELKTKLHHLSKDFKSMLADGLINEKGFFTEKYLELNSETATENVQDSTLESQQDFPQEKLVNEDSKEPMITMSASDLEAMFSKKIQEAKESFIAEMPKAPIVKEEKKQEHITLTNTDDIPELDGFEYKDRIYEILINPNSTSHGIRNRSKRNSPLQYIHPVTKQPYSLRLTSNQSSFFEEKQSKEPGSAKLRYVKVIGKSLFVPASDILLQKFLHIHPDRNVVFAEVDATANANKKIAELDLSFKAETLIRELSYPAQDALARIVCTNYQEGAESAIIKTDLFAVVRNHKDPKLLIKLAEDDNLLIKGLVKTAMSRGYLRYSDYRFIDSNNIVILEVGRNQDESNAIAEYLQSNAGFKLREDLEKNLY